MNLENVQNSLLLALGKGNALAISLGAQNCERTCSRNSHRTNKTWIPPPGKSTRCFHTCCPQNHMQACLILQLIDNENGLGQQLMIGMGPQENMTSKSNRIVPYSSREIKQNKKTKGINNVVNKQEQPVEEFNKMAAEQEMNQETFLKYADDIKEELDELRDFVKKLERNQRNISHRNSQLKYSNEEKINKLLGISSVSEIDSRKNQLNRKESFSQPVAESTRLTSRYEDKNFKHPLKWDPSSSSLSANDIPTVSSKGGYQGEYKDQFKENFEPENGSFEDARHCEVSTELVKKLADTSMKMKLCIDLVNQQDKVVDTKQKKYIQAAEKLHQDQLNIIKRLYKVIDTSTSASDSSENRVARESKKLRPTKIESGRTSNNDSNDINTVNGKKKTRQKNFKKCKDESLTKTNPESTGKHNDSLPSFFIDRPNPRPLIPIPKRRDDINNYSSINESRIKQDYEVSRHAENSRSGQAFRRTNYTNPADDSEELQVENDLNRSDSNYSNRNSDHERTNHLNNSIKTSQASHKPAKAGRTASKLSEIPRKSDSYFSSEDSVLHKTNSYDYVCKTIIKQIMRRYPPSATYGYNAIDGLAPPMTDIIRKIDQIVNDIMPSMGGEQKAPPVLDEERDRASVKESYIQPPDEPLNDIQQNERQSNRNLTDMQNFRALERTQNRDNRLQNRRSSERRDPRNSIDIQENRPRNERGVPDRTHRSSINRDLLDGQEDLPPHDRLPNQNSMGNQRNLLPRRERQHDRRRSNENSINRDFIGNHSENIPPHERPLSRTSLKRQTNGRNLLPNIRQQVSNGRHSNEKQEKYSKRMSKNENYPELELEEGDLSAEELSQSRSQAVEGVDQEHHYYTSTPKGVKPTKRPSFEFSQVEKYRPQSRNRNLHQSRSSHSFTRLDSVERCDCIGPCTNPRHMGASVFEDSDSKLRHLSNERRDRTGRHISYPSRSSHSFTRLDSMEICNCVGSCNNPRHVRESMLEDSDNKVEHVLSETRDKTGRSKGSYQQSRSSNLPTGPNSIRICDCDGSCNNPTHIRESMLEDANNNVKHTSTENTDRTGRNKESYRLSQSSYSTRPSSMEMCDCDGPCTNSMHFRESMLRDAHYLAGYSSHKRDTNTKTDPKHFKESLKEMLDSEERNHSKRLKENIALQGGSLSKSSASLEQMECNCVGLCKNPRHLKETSYEKSDSIEWQCSCEGKCRNLRHILRPSAHTISSSSSPDSSGRCSCEGRCRNLRHLLRPSDSRTSSSSKGFPYYPCSSSEPCDCPESCTNPFHEQSGTEISNRRSDEGSGSSERTHKSISMSKERQFNDSGYESDKNAPFKPKHDKFDTLSERSHDFEDYGYASNKSSSDKWKHDKSEASSKRSYSFKDSGYVSDKSALSKQSHNFKDSGYVSDKSSSFPEKHDKSSEQRHDFEDSGYASDKSTSPNQKQNILSKRWSDSYQDQLSPELKLEDSRYTSDKSRDSNSSEITSKSLEDSEKSSGSSRKLHHEKAKSSSKENKLQIHQEHDNEKPAKKQARSKSRKTIRSSDVEPFVDSNIKAAEDHEENNSIHPRETPPNPRHSPEEDMASKQEMTKEYIQESDSKVEHGPKHTSTPKKERPVEKESFGISQIANRQLSSKQASDGTSDDSNKHGKSSQHKNKKDEESER